MAKKTREIVITRNYLYKYILKVWVANRNIPDPETGEKSVVSIFNGGGSRAGKTVSIVQAIITIMTHYADPRNSVNKKLHIIIWRDTLVSARETYKDVIKVFGYMGYIEAQAVKGKTASDLIASGEADYTTTHASEVKIEMYGHLIEFRGLPEDGKEPTGSDISFVNEAVEHKNKSMFMRIKRKTQMLFLADWNPKDSVHFVYDIRGHNVFYTTTTYWDNKHLPDGLKADAEKECPWPFDECELYLETHDSACNPIYKQLPPDFNFADWKDGKYQFDGFIRRKWLKEERPQNCREEDYHLYRGVNKLNEANGSISRNLWLTYGEGIPSGQEGMVFGDMKWVDSFPESADNVHFGLDMGFTNDPSCLTRVGNIGIDLYIEKLTYQPTATSDLLFDLIERPLLNEERRRYIEANGEEWYEKLLSLRANLRDVTAAYYKTTEQRAESIAEAKEKLLSFKEAGIAIDKIVVVCDTQDIYKGRGGMEEQAFVTDLNRLSVLYGYYWNFIKVGSKPIVPGISLMKKFNLHGVRDNDFKLEQENYLFVKTDDGKPTNLPDKNSKWNHIWDSARYCIWRMFKHLVVRE